MRLLPFSAGFGRLFWYSDWSSRSVMLYVPPGVTIQKPCRSG
jgi:hypothetical protein